MRRRILVTLSVLVMLVCTQDELLAQGVAINNQGNPADASAMLDVSSTNKGMLVPRMTTAQRDAIANPAEGLIIFNTDTKCLNYHYSPIWMEVCGDCISPQSPIVTANGPLCETDTLLLTASAIAGASYSWTGPGGYTSSQQNPVINGVLPSQAGTYTVVATVNGCTTNPNSVFVAVNAMPSSSFISSPASPNVNQSVTFSPTQSGATYSWTFQSGTPATSTAQNPVVQWSSAGTYNVELTVTSNGCSSTSSMSVVVMNCPGGTQNFAYTGSIQTWPIPSCVSQLTIEVVGASGGNGGSSSGTSYGGKGARMIGTFNVTGGSDLKILVGGQGETKNYYVGGGGGGSFVWVDGQNTPLIIAGGGGGAGGQNGGLNSYHNGIDAVTAQNGTNGNGVSSGGGSNGNGGSAPSGHSEYGAGGCGWYTNGAAGSAGGCSSAGGGQTPLNGGAGGSLGGNSANVGNGGFGGGGGGQGACNAAGGGGGGGYSGGGGGVSNYGPFSGGGGAGSFNSGSNQSNTAGFNTGNGYIIITY